MFPAGGDGAATVVVAGGGGAAVVVGVQVPQVWGHFLITHFLEHFPLDFHLLHFVADSVSTQGASVGLQLSQV